MNQLNDNIREDLEIRINDAADGLLNESELEKLEKDLQSHPDLLSEYHDIMSLPELSTAYGDLSSYQNDMHVHQILNDIRVAEQTTSFENITMFFFRRYALAASILVLAISSIFYVSMPVWTPDSDFTFEDLLYPAEELAEEDYITYLNDWMEQ